MAGALEKLLSNVSAELSAPPPPPLEFSPVSGPQELAYNCEADVIGFGGAAGGGKALSLDTAIATPSGWSTMGELCVGDTVFDENGIPCSVTGVTEIMHNRPCYRLRFSDGSELIADAEHQWLTFDACELAGLTRLTPEWRAKRRSKRPSGVSGNKSAAFTRSLSARNAARVQECKPAPSGTIRTTEVIGSTLFKGKRKKHAIPVTKPLEIEDCDLPVDPYCLGAWLGDGTGSTGGFTTADTDVVREFESAGYVVTHVPSSDYAYTVRGLKTQLRELCVLGNKHIPPIYLRSSRRQRLSLLQGLMDTDGTVTDGGSVEFTNTNRRIAEGVLELICSLGWKARMVEGRAKLKGKDCGPKFDIKWTPDCPVFRLSRKSARQRFATRRTTKFRYIESCERIESVPVRCIEVDSPSHLYLAGKSMIPTHNSFLMLGLALTKHRRSVIFRREAMQLRQLIEDSRALIGERGQFNENKLIWRSLPGDRMLEFGGVRDEEDKKNWQGRAHDLKGFDEATEFTESQIRFLTAWNRTAVKGQKCTSILCFNPPTTPEGEWIIKYFGPWIDPDYEGEPAAPGEIRWFAMVGGIEKEVADDREFVVIGGEVVYDFEPSAFSPTEIIKPRSRTFIRAKVTDNPYLLATDYVSTLQALDEPLRSQMLEGKFAMRAEENPFQLVPTAIVNDAQALWKKHQKPPDDAVLVSVGVDVARGGKDEFVVAPLFEGTRLIDGKERKVLHFAEPKVYPGVAVPDGQTARDLVIREWRSGCSINIDAIGVGSSPVDMLRDSLESDLLPSDPRIVHAVNNGGGAPKEKKVGKMVPIKDKTGKFEFVNMRAFLAIRFREMMVDQSEYLVELPPNISLRADLTVPTWGIRSGKYFVESKDDIKKRLPERRSTNVGDAVILATFNRAVPGKKKRQIKVLSED